MKILYDHQVFVAQSYGGISRYFFELMQHYHQTRYLQFELTVRYHENAYLQNASFVRKGILDRLGKALGYPKFIDKEKINRKASTQLIMNKGFDVFHPTFYDPYFLPLLDGKPFVLTIYDLTHEKYPEYYQRHQSLCEAKKTLAEHAATIIAISETTKKDIIKFYGISSDKIHVIYLGSSFQPESVSEKATAEIRLPERFLLFLGKRHGYKNFVLLVNAMAQICMKDSELMVICAGAATFTSEEIDLMKKLNVQGRFIHMTAPDEVLDLLYRRAIAFVFPSLNEGFGIPILEAFSCGCPVICSNTSSLPEVGGSAAEYFDPMESTSLGEAIEGVIYDNAKRKNLIEKGFRQNALFSWEKAALQTMKVYESVL
jgi:glycosyltransferase involved in cell wall biosynthesis